MAAVSAALRRAVADRAGGRCEYCGMPEAVVFAPHEVDHIIAQKHGGRTEAENLAFSCTLCNKHKGSDIASLDPETGTIVPLFHPRRERWSEHFRLAGARVVPLTSAGRVTVRLLQLNHPDRVAERELLIAAERFSP
jgi:5-methylcytosine-specific restriction endonuclease McrA